MTYHVETTNEAKANRAKCFDYIAERSPAGALRWIEAYEQAVESLFENPHTSLAPESQDHEEEIWQRLFKTRHGLQYRPLFLIRDDTIYILHVRGSGQDLMAPDELEKPEHE
jgi:plasmid stabilization system protein ParE